MERVRQRRKTGRIIYVSDGTKGKWFIHERLFQKQNFPFASTLEKFVDSECQQRIIMQKLIMHNTHITLSVCNCIDLDLPQNNIEKIVPKIGNKNLDKSMLY